MLPDGGGWVYSSPTRHTSIGKSPGKDLRSCPKRWRQSSQPLWAQSRFLRRRLARSPRRSGEWSRSENEAYACRNASRGSEIADHKCCRLRRLTHKLIIDGPTPDSIADTSENAEVNGKVFFRVFTNRLDQTSRLHPQLGGIFLLLLIPYKLPPI